MDDLRLDMEDSDIVEIPLVRVLIIKMIVELSLPILNGKQARKKNRPFLFMRNV